MLTTFMRKEDAKWGAIVRERKITANLTSYFGALCKTVAGELSRNAPGHSSAKPAGNLSFMS